MQQKYLYILIFILIGLVSCEGNKNPIADHIVKPKYDYDYYKEYYPDYYKDKFLYEVQNNSPIRNPKYIQLLLAYDSISLIKLDRKYLPNIWNDTQNVFKISSIKTDYIYYQYIFYKRILYMAKNGAHLLYHIEYPLELSGRKKVAIFGLIDYGFERDRPFQSAYIIWTSKPANNARFTPNIQHGPHSVYMWEINRSTDTIITNLSYSTIKRLYPDFYGVYRKGMYKSITIDESLPSDEFFNKIEFK